ncbi:MAG: pseudouridine synthase [Bradymonadia bacterium]
MLLALHKPWGVLSRFSPDGSANRTLADLGLPRGIYPIGRLDADSEGLLLLTDEGELVDVLLNPRRGHPRAYWVQVEGLPDATALAALEAGPTVQGRATRACTVRRLEVAPDLPPREPPVRFRKSIPDCWIELELTEGRNRQVRRMTAAVGHPTLRLVRARIGDYVLGDLPRGAFTVLEGAARAAVLTPRRR